LSATVFDRWARTYDDCALQPMFQAAHDAVLGRARRLATRPRRVLDVGCGTGRLLRAAMTLFPDSVLVGVDVSSRMLAVAGSVVSPTRRLGHVQAAAERLPFTDATFDLVVSTASFRHWADQDAAMREIGRVLAPGGVLAFADVFTVRRRGLPARLARRLDLPPALRSTLATADLRPVSIDTVDGFGPVPEITVVLAQPA
jgi:malonyl-CoA O-methyltransferase